MGGRAFKDLYCPRINPDVYLKVKARATTALQTIFAHVVVPTEMPEKVRLRNRVLFVYTNHTRMTTATLTSSYAVHYIPQERTR
jgi:hypothetical protein